MKKLNKKTLIEKKNQTKKALFYKYCYVRSSAL
jgi:hypothetical protein